LKPVVVLAVFCTAFASAAPGGWLDNAPEPWNRPGGRVPVPPKDAQRRKPPAYCKSSQRPPNSPEEKLVARAGWQVFASSQDGKGITVVGAAAALDGMCRPDPYQDFVFVEGVFAGTLAPEPMRARSDGSSNRISFPGLGQIEADFSRYKESDPLCCPSRITVATFEIRKPSGKPVVHLVSAKTRPA
jgi:hypothetical protein